MIREDQGAECRLLVFKLKVDIENSNSLAM